MKQGLKLSVRARVALHRLQSVRGNALYVVPSFASGADRAALAELEDAGLAQVQSVVSGIIERPQATLTPAGRAADVGDLWADVQESR